MRRARRFTVASSCVVLALVAAPAAAQRPVTPADYEARNLFEAGRAAFNSGRYEEALERFERAYELSRRPRLLFNIGTVADRLRRDERALEAFEAYLRELPDAPNAIDVRARIHVLRSAVGDRAVVQRLAPWLLVGGSAALVITGAGLLIGSEADAAAVRDAADGTAWSSVASAYDRAPVLGNAGWITLAAGAVGLAVGVGLVLAADSGEDRAGSEWSLRAGLAGLEWTARLD